MVHEFAGVFEEPTDQWPLGAELDAGRINNVAVAVFQSHDEDTMAVHISVFWVELHSVNALDLETICCYD